VLSGQLGQGIGIGKDKAVLVLLTLPIENRDVGESERVRVKDMSLD
jgi:hypothetical protein